MVSAGKLFEANTVGDDRVERDNNNAGTSGYVVNDERNDQMARKQSGIDSGTKKKHVSKIVSGFYVSQLPLNMYI